MDSSNRSCKWLREKGMLDEHYLSIDLTRFMCSSCEVGQEECCVRKVEAVALMLKSNRKRKVQRKKRLSYDKHHVDCARKASKDAASQDASAKAKKFGVLNDSTNYQKVVMKCRADTPSKIQPRQARRITKCVAEHVNAVTSAILPGMNPSQRERVLAKSYNFNAKIEHANSSSTGSEKEDAEDPSLLVTALRAFRPHLQGKKPIDRRQHIAGFTSMTRKDAERALDINISRWEWSQAKMHARYPGPLKPVERIKHRRIRIPQKTLLEIFDFIGDNMQGHAYGMNACKLENGELIQLDAVSTTASNSKLCRDWAQVAEMITLCESEIPAENNRCKQKCPKTKKRCLLVKNHEKKHKFTPADSVCASTLERIINKLGNGAIKSLAGLDDEDTLKGGGNFKRLHEIHEILANIHCVTPHEKKETEKQITEALLFHKTNFKKHLSKGNKICQCISCGFSVPDPTPSPFSDDPTISPTANNTDASNGKKTKAKKGGGKAAAKKNASNGKKTGAKKGSGKAAAEKNASNWTECMPCKNRDENYHEGPCSDCEKSFGIFDSLLKMATSAQNLPNISARQMENFSELEFEIKKRRKYHIDWRSHIVRKKTESDYDRKQLQTMAKNEVLLISDFKMKILSYMFRESQKEFYAKRGTTCLGFMTVKKADQDAEDVDVHFHLLFSNDTTQDSHFVLAAKAFMFAEFLPTQFPNSEQIGVHFRADGAGCFNSNSAKACMPLWESWTDGKVREKSFRISVNGDGKTSLDACFGKLTSNLHQAVDNGCDDITDAKSCVAAFEAGPGIGGATAATFLPTRESLLETEEKRLKQYYMLELNDDNKSIQCFHQSGFGSGCKISIESINKQWGLEMPVMPTYVATTQTQTSESDGNATHKIESKQSRDKKTSLKRAEVQQQKMVAERKKLCDDALKMGVIKCNHHEPGKGYCIASYLSEKALDKHATSGKHMYASQNFVDKAVLLASDPGGLLAAGSRCNRSDEYGIVDVVDGVGEGVTEGTEWYSIGCYRKPGRAAPQRKSEALKKELDRMFLAGEKNTGSKKNAQKYTACEARAELSSMLDTNGRLLFSNTSLLGPLPSEDQIKQYWSTFKRNQSKKGAILLEAQLEDQTEV